MGLLGGFGAVRRAEVGAPYEKTVHVAFSGDAAVDAGIKIPPGFAPLRGEHGENHGRAEAQSDATKSGDTVHFYEALAKTKVLPHFV